MGAPMRAESNFSAMDADDRLSTLAAQERDTLKRPVAAAALPDYAFDRYLNRTKTSHLNRLIYRG